MKKLLRFAANKLVRDKTKEKVINQGIILHQRIMEHEEYVQELQKKLIEEAHEVAEINLKNLATKNDLLSEIADVLEVVESLAKACHISADEITQARAHKNTLKGAFNDRIFGICMDVEEGSEGAKYYQSQPHKYPEIFYKQNS